jgi:hypothetical protein
MADKNMGWLVPAKQLTANMQLFQTELQRLYTSGSVNFPNPQFLNGDNSKQNLNQKVQNLLTYSPRYDAFAVAGSTGVDALAQHLLDVEAEKRRHQARADDALQSWGVRAPAPVAGESIKRYRRRLVAEVVQPRLPEGHDYRRLKFHDSERVPWEMFEKFEPQIYADAAAAGLRPDSAANGEMRMITRVNPENGHKENLFFGRRSFIEQFKSPVRRVASFLADGVRMDATGRALR